MALLINLAPSANVFLFGSSYVIDNLSNLSDWHVELNKKQNDIEFPIAQLVDENKDSLFLFGLSKSYYELIKKDLEQIKDRSNLRFLGFKNSAIMLLDEPTAVLTPQETSQLKISLETLSKEDEKIDWNIENYYVLKKLNH